MTPAQGVGAAVYVLKTFFFLSLFHNFGNFSLMLLLQIEYWQDTWLLLILTLAAMKFGSVVKFCGWSSKKKKEKEEIRNRFLLPNFFMKAFSGHRVCAQIWL